MNFFYIFFDIVEGKIIVKFDVIEFENGFLEWKNVLIVYVVGDILLY